jgi:thiamine transport system ATP-binding protein
MLEVDDITVRFGERAVLDRVSLTVDDGQIVALTGASGSGKSTLLRVIAGLQPTTSGTVRWNGANLAPIAPHRRRFGFVFQDEQLFPHLSVAGNIGFGLRMAKVPQPQRDRRIAELLELIGLVGFDERSIDVLSGGEAKRVALARALAPRPELLLLDEPLTGLDTDLHDRLVGDVREILHSARTTAIHVTHDRAEAHRIADRVIALENLGSGNE